MNYGSKYKIWKNISIKRFWRKKNRQILEMRNSVNQTKKSVKSYRQSRSILGSEDKMQEMEYIVIVKNKLQTEYTRALGQH